MNIKISVIGTGHLGSIHAKLLKSCPNAELIGIFDIDVDKSKNLSEELNCRQFTSIAETLEYSDAITIASPTSLHYEIAKQCLNAGKHCLIEKPITSTYEEAKELISIAKEKSLMVQVGHVERFNPALSALKDYSLKPVFIEAHRLSQFKPRAIDVSVIHDLMIHDIDIMLWLVKSPVKRIDANGVAVLTDAPDIANARITFENGTVANLTASRISANPMRKMRIFQHNAYISIDFGNQDVEVFRILDETENFDDNNKPASMLGMLDAGIKNKKIVFEKPVVKEINAIAEEQKSFVRAIIEKSPVAVSAEEAAEALRITGLINEMILK
ncbi:MAG: Gfo/Idh/MocA family oxidoreductase [Bacteroidota bacterium]